MKFRNKILPVFLLVCSVSAYANLPDEINYEPYQLQYQRLSADVDAITANLEAATSRLNQAYATERQVDSDITNIQSDTSTTESRINELDNLRTDLMRESSDLNNELNTTTRRLNSLEAQRNNIDRDIIREDRRLAPIQDRLNQVEQRLANQSVEVENKRVRFQRAENMSNSLRGELQRLKNERDQLKARLDQLESQLANVDAQIAKLQADLANLPQRISRLENKLNTETASQVAMKAELDRIRAELAELMRTNRADPRVRELRGQVATKSRELSAQDAVVTDTRNKLNQAKNAERGLKSEIAKLEQSKNTLPNQIRTTQANFQTKVALIETKKAEVGNAETRTAQLRRDLDTAAVELNNIQTRRNRVAENLALESRTRNRLYRDLEDTTREINRTQNDLNNTTNAYNNVVAQIDNIDREIPQLERRLDNNDRTLRGLLNDLTVVQEQIVTYSSDVTNLTSQQSSAITDRDRKYQEYVTRYDYYSDKLNEAKSLGASQTGDAETKATIDSDKYVSARSNEVGSAVGSDLSSAQAKLWGAIRAEIKGYQDGYDEGYASSSDRERGSIEGTQAGIDGARDYATSVLKPQFFNQEFNRRIGQNTQKNLEGLNEFAEFEEATSSEKILFDILSTVKPVTSSEIAQSNQIATNLDSLILASTTNLNQVLKQAQEMQEAQNVYEAPSSIPYGRANCNNVYKNVAEFIQACKSSYTSTFASLYNSEYFNNFSEKYPDLYVNVLETTTRDQIEAKYNSEYASSYPVAKLSGVADGKKDIYNETFTAAKTAAYNNELPKATEVARGEANLEVGDWITNNATLSVQSASITAQNLRGGAMANVALVMKNISPASLTKPVKIIILDSKNVELSAREYYLKAAAGNTTTAFTDISFKINDRVQSNQEIKLTAKVILSGGKYTSTREESFTVKAMTELNPAVGATYEYDSTPQIVTTFRRRTLIHNLDASVSPLIESVRDGYTVELSAMSDSVGMIDLKNTRVQTNSISYGSAKSVRFQYTFPRSADGKLVRIKLTYKYKSEVVKTEVIELRPH